GVGFITSAHDKANILFSLITSFAKMIDSINAGDPADKALSFAPHAEIRSQPLDSNGFPITITNGGQPSYSPVDTFTVIPAQLAPATTPTAAVTPTLIPQPTNTNVAPTIPPTNTAAIVLGDGGICPGVVPSRLHIGIQAQVTPGAANRL